MQFLSALLSSMLGAIAQGLIWGVMAIGVYITYKILDVADLTVDGSLCTGGAVCVILTLNGVPMAVALIASVLVGMLAGFITGIFHTAFGIPAILADSACSLLRKPSHHGLGHGQRKQSKLAHQRR